MTNYWIKVDHVGKYPCKDMEEFLVMDEDGDVFVGCTPFDYYDAKYWFPMPEIPMDGVITNDDWVTTLAKKRILKEG